MPALRCRATSKAQHNVGYSAAEGAQLGDLTDPAATWFRRWVEHKAARGQTSSADKWSHYVHHIRPALGAKHVKDWTGDDLRGLVATLDRRVSAGELAWKTARNVWATTTKACDDARSSKSDALRVRRDDATDGIEGPDGGIERGKVYLYPSEVTRFLASPAVPKRWKRVVALAIYLLPRGELRALRLGDVDLEHGTVHVHQSWDRRARADKSTKSKRSRRFASEPSIAPLLQFIADEQPEGEHVAVLPSERDMSRGLSRWQAKARVTRPELFADTDEPGDPIPRPPRHRDHLDGDPRRRTAKNHAARRAHRLRDHAALRAGG